VKSIPFDLKKKTAELKCSVVDPDPELFAGPRFRVGVQCTVHIIYCIGSMLKTASGISTTSDRKPSMKNC